MLNDLATEEDVDRVVSEWDDFAVARRIDGLVIDLGRGGCSRQCERLRGHVESNAPLSASQFVKDRRREFDRVGGETRPVEVRVIPQASLAIGHDERLHRPEYGVVLHDEDDGKELVAHPMEDPEVVAIEVHGHDADVVGETSFTHELVDVVDVDTGTSDPVAVSRIAVECGILPSDFDELSTIALTAISSAELHDRLWAFGELGKSCEHAVLAAL